MSLPPFKEFIENFGQDPVQDIDKYVTGLRNRVLLLTKEEISERAANLKELADIIYEKINQ